MKNIILTIILFISISGFSQKQDAKNIPNMSKEEFDIFLAKKRIKLDSLRKIDFLDKNYTYLDANFKPVISSKTFNLAVEENKFIKSRIRNYKDSLRIILAYEIKDSDASRFATNRIGYTWLRLGYHLWLSEEECKEIGENFGFTHPYKFKEHIIDDKDKGKERLLFIRNFKKRMQKETNYQLDTFINTSNLLDFALHKNPVRIKAFKKIHKKH